MQLQRGHDMLNTRRTVASTVGHVVTPFVNRRAKDVTMFAKCRLVACATAASLGIAISVVVPVPAYASTITAANPTPMTAVNHERLLGGRTAADAKPADSHILPVKSHPDRDLLTGVMPPKATREFRAPHGLPELPAVSGPQSPSVVCCGGGGGFEYGPSSEYYVEREYIDSDDRIVPYRQGNSDFGMIHVENEHHIYNPEAIELTVSRGLRKPYSSGSPGHFDYIGRVYNRNLYETTGFKEVSTIVVGVWTERKEDGLAAGIMTAYCAGHQYCPSFVGIGDVAWDGQ